MIIHVICMIVYYKDPKNSTQLSSPTRLSDLSLLSLLSLIEFMSLF